MILGVSRNDLATALSRVTGVIDPRNTIESYAHVALEATGDEQDGQLTVRSTNGDMEAVETIRAAVGQPGATTVSAQKLGDLTRSLPDGAAMTMKLAERLAVSAGRSRFNLGVLPIDMFPPLWSEEWPHSIGIDAKMLGEMIARVAFAQSDKETRYYIKGVNFSCVAGRLRLVATNVHMISLINGPEVDEFPSCTAPSRMVAEMMKLLRDSEGDATLSFSESKVCLRCGDTSITSKIIDRSLAFPDYARAIPKKTTCEATLDVTDAMAAIRRAMIASQGTNDNTVRVTFKSGAVAVAARNSEAEALDEIDAEYDGEEVTISLNPIYLTDILNATPAERVTVRFTDNRSALTWACGDEGLVVIAPQRMG